MEFSAQAGCAVVYSCRRSTCYPSLAFATSCAVRKRAFLGECLAISRVAGCSQHRAARPRRYFRDIVIACMKHGNDGTDETLAKPEAKISRRGLLVLLNAALGAASLTLLAKMGNQFRAISPAGVLASVGIQNVPARKADLTSIEQTSAEHRAALEFVANADARNISCPMLPKNADWINSPRLSFAKELKGKLVLLDFFTYCCINCQHVLPKLAALEHKYGEDGSRGFVVVGIHSAKYTAEHESRNIAAAVARHHITHPVMNDVRMEMWNKIGIRGWPSFALVGPNGNLIAQWSGERQEHDIDNVVAAALEYYQDHLDRSPLPPAPKQSMLFPDLSKTPLRYPSKILLSDDASSVYVADSANNRILKYDVDTGACLASYGNGEAAFVDAKNVLDSSFHFPQGLAIWKNKLYVADTENHAVRMIDLSTGEVFTVGGNGEQGFDYAAGKSGVDQALSSPWDLEIAQDEGILYVAMAGIHQIWCLDIGKSDHGLKSQWQVFSGTGRELEKNSSVGRTASWSQPSHLSIGRRADDGTRTMYVADSESSTVRSIDIDPLSGNHPTRTLAGGDGLIAENMFAFGDKDGKGARAKFQHPLAVHAGNDANIIYVADSYNHRIKIVDRDGNSTSFVGSGKPGFKDGGANTSQFWEPSGLALSKDGSRLFVCDCNNSRIRVVNTQQRTVSTLQLEEPPRPATQTVRESLISDRESTPVATVSVNQLQKSLPFEIQLPDRSILITEMPNIWQANEVLRNGAIRKLADGLVTASPSRSTGVFEISRELLALLRKNSQIEVETIVHYCSENDQMCKMDARIFKLKPSFSEEPTVVVQHTIDA